MCQKQCRDENGFKVRHHMTTAESPLVQCIDGQCLFVAQCHQTSESHIRQMSLFAENAHTYQESFSQEFEKSFMEVLKRKYVLDCTARWHAHFVWMMLRAVGC